MKRAVQSIVFFVVLATFFSVTTKAQELPLLELKDIHGRQVKLSDYKGKVLLLNFWATWCPPCRAELPDLISWQRKYRKHGLQLVGVTYPPTDLQKVRNFARRIKINYPILLGTKQTMTLFVENETLPTTIVIGRDQTIRAVIEGILLPEEFDLKVKPLLKMSDEL